jgi:cell division protein ZapA
MAEIDVIVAGRTYRLGCEDGQEPHLAALAASIDAEARAIAAQTGTMQEARLLLMAALMIADREAEAQAAKARAEAALADAQARPAADPALAAALARLEAMVAQAEAGV